VIRAWRRTRKLRRLKILCVSKAATRQRDLLTPGEWIGERQNAVRIRRASAIRAWVWKLRHEIIEFAL
jgi:hypothetical protein